MSESEHIKCYFWYPVEDSFLLIQGRQSHSVFFNARRFPGFHWQGKFFLLLSCIYNKIMNQKKLLFTYIDVTCAENRREIQETCETICWDMVLRGQPHSWTHILRHVLGWKTRMETSPTSNSRGWSPTMVKQIHVHVLQIKLKEKENGPMLVNTVLSQESCI